MVTGDNALTAISVGRQCNIIHDDQRVYFGDLDEQNRLIWKDFDDYEKVLDDENLDPIGGIKEYEDAIEIEELKEEIEYFENKEEIDM